MFSFSFTALRWFIVYFCFVFVNIFDDAIRVLNTFFSCPPFQADIAQLPVAHARTPQFQGNPFDVTFCTTTIVRKKCGNRLHMRTRSIPVTWLPVPVTWFPVTSDDVTSDSSTSLHLQCDFSCADILLTPVFKGDRFGQL